MRKFNRLLGRCRIAAQKEVANMMIIVCDLCKKTIQNASRGNNYFTLLNRAICKSCYRKLRDEVQDVMEERMDAKQKFDFLSHKKLFVATMEKHCR
jgi:Icc-related predicted phosphoesterase